MAKDNSKSKSSCKEIEDDAIVLTTIINNTPYKYEELFEKSIGWLNVVYKNIINISTPVYSNLPYKEPDRIEYNIDTTDKNKFDVRQLEALGIGFKRKN